MGKLIWHTERRKISDLIPYEGNPRIMTKKQVDDLKKSLEKFNLVEIPVIDTHDRIIAGHMRLKIMQMIGRGEEEIEVRVPNRELTEKEFREYNIRSNKNTGSWDMDILANSFDTSDLVEWGFDEKELGIEKFDRKQDAEPLFNQADELNNKWQVKEGDLWILGDHRILCGDSTKREDVEKVMAKEKAILCISDPPYNYDYQYESTDYNLGEEDFIKFTNTWFFIARQFASVRIITPGLKNLSLFLRNYGATWICAWVKKNAMTASKIGNLSVWEPIVFDADDYDWEPVIVYGKPKKKVKRDVYEYPIKVQQDVSNHPCPKLLEFWSKLIKDFSKPTDSVLDVFLGSGTTVVACQNLNRKCRGIEISPNYVAVCLERMATAFPGIEIKRL